MTHFPHQDPAVQPSVQVTFDPTYTQNLESALRRSQQVLQDIDQALLGLVAPSRPGGALSTARQLIRTGVLDIRNTLAAGGVR